MSIAGWRDIDFPDEAEMLIHDLPEEMRWDALAEFACDRDGLNDSESADQRQERGDKESARRLLAHLPPSATPEDTRCVWH